MRGASSAAISPHVGGGRGVAVGGDLAEADVVEDDKLVAGPAAQARLVGAVGETGVEVGEEVDEAGEADDVTGEAVVDVGDDVGRRLGAADVDGDALEEATGAEGLGGQALVGGLLSQDAVERVVTTL